MKCGHRADLKVNGKFVCSNCLIFDNSAEKLFDSIAVCPICGEFIDTEEIVCYDIFADEDGHNLFFHDDCNNIN